MAHLAFGVIHPMTFSFHPLFAAYIPLPPDGKFSDSTPFWSFALYGIGCVFALILMFVLIRKTRRAKTHRKKSEEIR